MKTLRITTALFLTVLAAAACTVSPTAPLLQPADASQQSDGTGFLGGGTRQP